MQLRWRFAIALGFLMLLGDFTCTFAQVNSYGRLPLSFEPNQGQTSPRVKFVSRSSHHTLFLTRDEAVLVLSSGPGDSGTIRRSAKGIAEGGDKESGKTKLETVLRMKLVNANPKTEITGTEELPGKVNYFIGNDPKRWHSNLPTYGTVQCKEVYPGIDLVYHGNQGQLEYDFIVHPGADPSKIGIELGGADRLEVDGDGDLLLHTTISTIRQRRPAIYQEVNGFRREVSGGYVLKDRRHVGFQVGAYDRGRQLVIDPLIYSTYLGGISDDRGTAIAVDSAGSAYVTGRTFSTNFPTTAGAFQPTPPVTPGNGDAFVTKLNPTGSALVYSTYLGGNSIDEGFGIAVDSAGSAYVTGDTFSANFPTTAGAFQTALNGSSNAFVTKLDPTGSMLVYSTYLGGSSTDQGVGISVDWAGAAYVTGFTASPDFPTTTRAFQTTCGCSLPTSFGVPDAFVTKLNSSGSGLVYSTFLGGSDEDEGRGILVDWTGSAYVTGRTASSTDFPRTPGAFQTTFGGGNFDAFVTKLNPTGSALVYSTYLGGNSTDEGFGIAVDSAGSAHVTGDTMSANFPARTGAFQTTFGGGTDAFVTKLNSSGSGLVYSSYLGGSGTDGGLGIGVDLAGSAYVTGLTGSNNFPTTPGAFQTTFAGGNLDAFVTRLNPVGSGLIYSTYLGGSNIDEGVGIALDLAGSAYVTGLTGSTNFPTTAGAFQTTFGGDGEDAFVAKVVTAATTGAPGEVEGSGKIAVRGGFANFGFEVERETTGGAPKGELEYRNFPRRLTVHATLIRTFDIVGNTATFSGDCKKKYDGGQWMTCTFGVAATDNDNPRQWDGHEESGRGQDTFTIQVSGEPIEGGTLIRGNIEIEQPH